MTLAQAIRSPGAALANALSVLLSARDAGVVPEHAADLSGELHGLLTAAERSQRATAQFRSDAQTQDASESLHDFVERALEDLGLYQGEDQFDAFNKDLASVGGESASDWASIERVVDVLERAASYAFRTSLSSDGPTNSHPEAVHLTAAQVEQAAIHTPLVLRPDLRSHLRSCDLCGPRVAAYREAAATAPFERYPVEAP